MPRFDLNTLVDYLIQAPRIVRDQSPMNWMFLLAPQDSDILLVWQPPQMGTQEASDGYVWADAEQAFTTEVKGYVRTRALITALYADGGARESKCTHTAADFGYRMNRWRHTQDAGFV